MRELPVRQIIKWLLIASLMIFCLIYGILMGKYQYPPFNYLKRQRIVGTVFELITGRSAHVDYRYHQINPAYEETDVEALIKIESNEDILKKRKALIDYLWLDSGFPSDILPDSVQADYLDERFRGMDNLNQIDRLEIKMDYGLNSVVYQFKPEKSNGRLIIYHQGHKGDFIYGKKIIQRFLNQGYTVLAFAMPLLGQNNQPVVQLERFGKFKLESHEHMILLDHPIRFFVTPIAVVLNYIDRKYSYSDYSMLGFSGGGWTTVLYAALDPRITRSIQVAGSYPLFLRSQANYDWGDFEQHYVPFYQIANYLELYLMAAAGEIRKHYQIINKYDSCCFAGNKYELYVPAVKNVLNQIGEGEFSVYVDENQTKHDLSGEALDFICKILED